MTQVRTTVRYPLLAVPRTPRWGLDSFAARVGLHPDLIRRYVALGLVPAVSDGAGRLWFDPSHASRVARIRRLHADLGLNYAALGLVLDLLERVRQLERAAAPTAGVQRPWT
jgi:chaperone modulatory protein CbpM